MSIESHPVVMCNGLDESLGCGVVALDHTLRGLGTIVGSATQLPAGWEGPRPGDHADGPHLCPSCVATRNRQREDEKVPDRG